MCRGSGLRKPQSRSLCQRLRHWVSPHLRRWWPFARRNPKSENESAQALDDTCRVGTVTAGTLEKLVNQLVPSLQSGDPFFVPAFLGTYKRFATTRQVLDLLFKRYGFFCPDREEDDQLKNAICSFLGCWLDLFPEDLCQPSDLSSLNQVMAYVLLNVPHSALVRRVHLLLTRLEDPEPSHAEPH
ncbi:PREDICTED: ral guanine nucleotide dissociation stimulator-like [Galeopterus variegatus]|uniref:Ral guanine nucleotide dissociation stimulator-like n=1 Tax=Galeopterus variegatus TaxID=482537 RepID=A0ABM0RRH1_GALVR|nr:PREDICTED: ral guanine nucleotide dissociation stimulator-like [Galeopterus variegatus]